MRPEDDDADQASRGDTDEQNSRARGGTVDPKLLEVLVCPITKGPLRYDPSQGELISDQARLAYPIRDSIPIMLADEARQLDDAELRR